MRTFLFLTSILLITSCGPNFIYEQERSLSDDKWSYDEPLSYEFEVADTSTRYNLYLDINHKTDFPFQNLYTLIETTYPDGRNVESKISIDLADQLGKWYGKCNGENCRLRVNLQQNTFFKDSGKHQIVFQQYTRKDALEGVQSLSFMVEQLD